MTTEIGLWWVVEYLHNGVWSAFSSYTMGNLVRSLQHAIEIRAKLMVTIPTYVPMRLRNTHDQRIIMV